MDSVSTDHKRLKFLTDSACYVEPIEHVLSVRSDLRFVSSSGYHQATVVEDTMQYIPIELLLGHIRADLSHAMHKFSLECRSDDVICHLFDTCSFKKHPFFIQFPDAFALHLYVDGFETTKALGSHTGVHKLEGLYLVVQNFPGELQSRLSSIFLVALWYAQDVKTYGYENILEPVINSLKQLELELGAAVSIAGQDLLIRAALVLISADNLGFNSLFGFSENFNATRFFSFCECTRDDTNKFFIESQLALRTRASYDTAVSSTEQYSYDPQTTGIKRQRPLNTLTYWHVTTNYVVDVMHDLLEGVDPYELYLIVRELALDKDINLKVEDINNALKFFNYSLADSNSRPPAITSFMTLRMSASEMWCFLRNLPLLIGHRIPWDNDYWKLLLLDITDIVFAPAITPNLCSYLSRLVEEHHDSFKTLFGNETRLIPKHHFLVHYASCMINSGPPVRYWSMRFEARHQILKDMARNSHRFKNICRTLAIRSQIGLAYKFLNDEFGKGKYGVGPAEEVLINALDDEIAKSICNDLKMCGQDSVFDLSRIEIGHYCFKPHAVSVWAVTEGIPKFGIVNKIISVEQTVYFIMELLETTHYDEHFHSYAVKYSSNKVHICCALDSLKYHIPLQFHVITYENSKHMLISLRYVLF